MPSLPENRSADHSRSKAYILAVRRPHMRRRHITVLYTCVKQTWLQVNIIYLHHFHALYSSFYAYAWSAVFRQTPEFCVNGVTLWTWTYI